MEVGFHTVPPGRLATIVTSLEMRAPPRTEEVARPNGLALVQHRKMEIASYRAVYERVGADWLWFSRLRLADSELTAIIHHEAVDVFTVDSERGSYGLLELDYRKPRQCELAFFGLAPTLIGRGVGRWLMSVALRRAWARDIDRLWVHTCTFDHPDALTFYRRAGFVPFQQEVEIMDDPRRDGTLSECAAPHVPLLRDVPPFDADRRPSDGPFGGS
ncbi:MAG: GNAT family N-acetyltransferase [Hyphomicrobiaceae bacterium]